MSTTVPRTSDVETRTVSALVEFLTSALNGTERVTEPAKMSRDIVAALLDVPRFWLHLHPDDAVVEPMVEAALRAVEQLRLGAPFAYAVGCATFRQLTLRVDRRVLIPRPETELIIDEIYQLVTPGGVAVDIGTGSGAIALALATERPEWFSRVIATDYSLDALAVAQANAERVLAGGSAIPVEIRYGSLLAPVQDVMARVVVSNPPYIAPCEMADLPASVHDWEPHLALVSDKEGLAATREIVRDAAGILESGGVLVLEVDNRRAQRVATMLQTDTRYDNIVIRPDLTGRERFVAARRM